MEPHDPHCRWPHLMVKTVGFPDGDVEFYGCDCALIAKVRADEQAKFEKALTSEKAEGRVIEAFAVIRADERARVLAEYGLEEES